ncbi:MAG: deoxynucleoside kinase [Pseudomonadota bacterium]|nr:deoxynucleoside kinase [Pseudomonadota bacterium]|tara:strand:+ start:237 stop:863 length:627 start_codon:yes stop_codon:yes gene_type:complete
MIKKKYIAIEGAIGVGKTTLAKRISDTIKCDTLFEDYIDNPFLKEFYDQNQSNSFSTQLFFLLRRIDQSQKVIEMDGLLISDFYFGKDDLFAKLNLNELEYSVYLEIREKLMFTPPTPDLIIYLQAPTDILLERIKKRGLEMEMNMKKKYIDSVNEVYMRHFHEYNSSPVLIINTSNVDINNENDFQILIQEISSDINGKKYFNPSSL